MGTSTGKYLKEDELSDDELDLRYFSTIQNGQEMEGMCFKFNRWHWGPVWC